VLPSGFCLALVNHLLRHSHDEKQPFDFEAWRRRGRPAHLCGDFPAFRLYRRFARVIHVRFPISRAVSDSAIFAYSLIIQYPSGLPGLIIDIDYFTAGL
jgi:hypothetical protein